MSAPQQVVVDGPPRDVAQGPRRKDEGDEGQAEGGEDAYNPSLGAEAAEAAGAVRLPSPGSPPTSGARPPSQDTDMYAIVKTGGKQYRVQEGEHLLVERLPQEGGERAAPADHYRSQEAVFDADGLERVKVTAKGLAHVRGEKLRVFKFKPKRGYKRLTGHRQELTRIQITEMIFFFLFN